MRHSLIPCLLALAVWLPVVAQTRHAHPTPPAEPAVETPRKAIRKPDTEPADRSGLGSLLHASPERVRARLGDPDVARAEGRGAFWTYRLPHCALFLFFTEGPKGLHVTGADTGVRKRGEPLTGVAACLASAVAAPEADAAPATTTP